MSSPMFTTIPARRLIAWSAGVTAMVAVLVMAGWLLRLSPLVRLAPPLPPVPFNVAFGLLGAGVGLWGVARDHRSLLLTGAALTLLLGSATLIEYATGTSMAVDALFIRDIAWATVHSPVSPRMPLASAFSFTLAGVAFAAFAVERRNRLAVSVAGTVGTVIVGLATVTLLSYATGVLSESIRIGAGVASGIQAALVFVVIGGTIVFHAWSKADLTALLPDWLPHAAATSMVVATVFFWHASAAEQLGSLVSPRTDLPAVVAALGIAVSLLLAATLGLVRRSVGTARKAERDHLARALETAKDGLWEKDLLTGIGNRSEAIWRRLGYTIDQIPLDGQDPLWASLIHPEDRDRVDAALAGHLGGDADAFEAQYRVGAKSGGWHWIVDRGRVVARGPSGSPVRLLGICADITEQKRAEQKLAVSEQRFRTMFESRLQFESLLDTDGTVLEANRTARSYLRTNAPDIRGRKLWDTPWWSGSERVERLKAAFTKASLGETIRYEEQIRTGPDRLAPMTFSLTPIMNTHGEAVQFLAEGQDLTEGKRNEGAMRELTTLSTMGRLAAKVAHEINNPLAGIQNAFLLIKDAVPESHRYFRFVGAIEREIARIAGVTRQLYETYRPDDDIHGSAVATVIGDAAALLERVNHGSGVAIHIDTEASPTVVPIPSGLLRQAVYNLVQNAVEASPPGGTVSIRAWRHGEVFCLSVRDQGPGVPEDLQGRIFDAFVSTKVGLATGGMGLGLSLVRRSVEAAGGSVEVRNPAEGGALFTIQIPWGPTSGDSP